jgi:hypothetical protein
MFAAGALAGQDQAGSQRSASPEGATVSFANLSDGDVVPPVFEVKFAVSGMGIAPAGSLIDNTGHHHLLIDVNEMPDLNLPLPANNNIHHFGKGQTKTELSLPEGKHSLQLLFADYAHVPHDPPVKSKVIHVEVSANAPPQDEPDE